MRWLESPTGRWTPASGAQAGAADFLDDHCQGGLLPSPSLEYYFGQPSTYLPEGISPGNSRPTRPTATPRPRSDTWGGLYTCLPSQSHPVSGKRDSHCHQSAKLGAPRDTLGAYSHRAPHPPTSAVSSAFQVYQPGEHLSRAQQRPQSSRRQTLPRHTLPSPRQPGRSS